MLKLESCPEPKALTPQAKREAVIAMREKRKSLSLVSACLWLSGIELHDAPKARPGNKQLQGRISV